LDGALRRGARGLPGGDSVAKILLRYRGVRRARYRPRLTPGQILAWADAYRARRGGWPRATSGPIVGGAGDTWMAVERALRTGCRGLPPEGGLATLLEKWRGVRNVRHLPPYTVRQILAWADAYWRRHGRWPSLHSGAIPDAPGETWHAVEGALRAGHRGLPGGDTLSQLLVRHRRRPRGDRPHHPARHAPLTIEQILGWADEFYRRNGRWPATLSGPIAGTRDETWAAVDCALRVGLRTLPGGSSIALLLEQHRGWRHKHHRPRFSARRVLKWADAYRRRTGRCPTASSGPIPESPGDTWTAVESALRNGSRGCPGRDSLFALLRRHGRVPADDPRLRRLGKRAGMRRRSK
jgi:hypothetical protein